MKKDKLLVCLTVRCDKSLLIFLLLLRGFKPSSLSSIPADETYNSPFLIIFEEIIMNT